MKRYRHLLALFILPVAFAQTTVFVSPDGSARIVEKKEVWLRGGSDTIRWQPVSANLDTASVNLSANIPLPIISQRFLHDARSRDTLLSLYRGHQIRVLTANGEVAGTLVASKDGQASIIETADGQLVLNPAGQIILPALDPPPALHPTLMWQLDGTTRAKKGITLRYTTREIHAKTSARLTFTDDLAQANLSIQMHLENKAGLDILDAHWVIESGDQPYALGGRHSLGNGDSLRIPTLKLTELAVATAFTFDPAVQGKPHIPLQRLQSRARIAIPANLAAPIPAGTADLFRGTNKIGNHKLGTLRPDAKIDLKLGDAPFLEGERKQSQFKELPDGKTQEQEITITLHNRGEAPLSAEAIEHPWGKWEVIAPSHPFKKAGKSILFAVSVPPKGKTVVTYRLRVAY